MTGAGCPDDNQLARLADGALGADDRAAIEGHLDGCTACAAVVAELAWVIVPARSAPPRFRLARRLAGAEGSTSERWLAIDRDTGADVELVFVARAGARPIDVAIDHPNLRRTIAVGDHDGAPFVAYAAVAGTTAAAWHEAAARTRAEILAVWRAAIAGVAALHAANLVHGGPSADDVLVPTDGAIVVGGAGLGAPPASGFIAPERLRGAPPSPAADQFALCASVWTALADRRPYTGATIGALAVQMMTPPAPPAAAPRADRGLYAALARGLTADPARRWPDLAALLRRI